jgi:uncharacterized protein with HEPN domain
MIGMRNVVIHQYFGVDEAVIWRTIQDDIPPLITAVSKILAETIEQNPDDTNH